MKSDSYQTEGKAKMILETIEITFLPSGMGDKIILHFAGNVAIEHKYSDCAVNQFSKQVKSSIMLYPRFCLDNGSSLILFV